MKKYLPYILILTILVGLFSPMMQARAQTPTIGTCSNIPGSGVNMQITQAACAGYNTPSTTTLWNGVPTSGLPAGATPVGGTTTGTCIGASAPASDAIDCTTYGGAWNTGTTSTTPYLTCVTQNQGDASSCQGLQGNPNVSASSTGNSTFQTIIGQNQCSMNPLSPSGTFWPGCFIQLSYGIFYVVPAFLLWLCAYIFNVMIAITLGSTLFAKSVFIPQAWAVVRDLSNIFFILILLYIGVELILGLGGHDTKKMIIKVILLALLINFSMFFTEIVIDTSNILALVFYNKLTVCTNPDPVTGACTRPYQSVTGEKDVAGGLVKAFDPTTLLTPQFFTNAGNQPIPGTSNSVQNQVSAGILIGITIIAGLIMLFAAYCFFIAGISFVGRLIELWVLLIFSPFAFMSSTIPILEKVDSIGWDAWLKRLLTVSFMAPIFMFFMYFIFLLVQINPFGNIITNNQSTTNTLLLVIIPALVILILLKKATEFAKKGSGALGEALIKGGEIVAGAAIAATGAGAIGLTASTLQGTVGQLSSKVANSERVKRWESEGVLGAGKLRGLAKYGATSSFDARKGAVGGALAAFHGVTGINLGHTSQFLTKDGGFEGDKKKKIEYRQQRASELEVGENSQEKQAVRRAEVALQTAKSDPARQNQIVKLNNGDTAAPVGSVANQGLGGLERALTAGERGVAEAERVLKDAVNKLNTSNNDLNTAKLVQSNAETTKNQADVALALNPVDPALIAAQAAATVALASANTTLATAQGNATTAQTTVNTAQTNSNNAISARDIVRTNLDTRQSDIRAAEAPIKNAERDLKVAQNDVIGANRTRRESYSTVVQNNILPTIDFLNAGMGNAQREAANKIRAGIQEQKPVASH